MAKTHLSPILLSGGIATLATTVAAGILGRIENKSLAAPLNATSHIIWGDDAAYYDELDLQHTVVGTVLNAGAMLAWAGVQELFFPRARTLAASALIGSGVSALAYLTDYYVVPKRLTPGFEMRLSPRGMFAMYSVLAAALALGARLAGGRNR